MHARKPPGPYPLTPTLSPPRSHPHPFSCSALLCPAALRPAAPAATAEDLDFKYPLKQACLVELDLFCKNIETGHSRVVRWGVRAMGGREGGRVGGWSGA